MSAWIYVVDSPWYAQADAAGAFTIRGLPPGEYQMEAWHEGSVDTGEDTPGTTRSNQYCNRVTDRTSSEPTFPCPHQVVSVETVENMWCLRATGEDLLARSRRTRAPKDRKA